MTLMLSTGSEYKQSPGLGGDGPSQQAPSIRLPWSSNRFLDPRGMGDRGGVPPTGGGGSGRLRPFKFFPSFSFLLKTPSADPGLLPPESPSGSRLFASEMAARICWRAGQSESNDGQLWCRSSAWAFCSRMDSSTMRKISFPCFVSKVKFPGPDSHLRPASKENITCRECDKVFGIFHYFCFILLCTWTIKLAFE